MTSVNLLRGKVIVMIENGSALLLPFFLISITIIIFYVS